MKKLLSLLVISLLVCSFGVGRAEGEDTITGTITLTEGWNLIAMPVLPVKPYTVERFISDVVAAGGWYDANLSNWEVPVVAVYKNGQFERYPKEGVTYNMVPGEAYFVYAKYVGVKFMIYPPMIEKVKIDITGRPLPAQISLNLDRGWSGRSIPERPVPLDGTTSFLTTLEQVSDQLVDQKIKATRIAFWSQERQEWEQYDLPLPPPIIDPAGGGKILFRLRIIDPDEGFFLLCEENGLYLPGLPPLPERISYTGILRPLYDPEKRLLYSFVIYTDAGTSMLIKGADNEIDQQLWKYANAQVKCTVSGTIIEVISPLLSILIVDTVTVTPVKELPETPELVKNGDFSFSIVGWTIERGADAEEAWFIYNHEIWGPCAIFELASDIHAIGPQYLTQNVGLELGKRYAVSFEIISYFDNGFFAEGRFEVSLGGVPLKADFSKKGVFTFRNISPVDIGPLAFCGYATVDDERYDGLQVVIDNVSVREEESPPLPYERVSYTGKVEGAIGFPEDMPPYGYGLIVTKSDGSRFSIGLKGINNEIENQLAEAAADPGNIRYVEGVVKIITTHPMLPPYTHTWEVLMVDKIEQPVNTFE